MAAQRLRAHAAAARLHITAWKLKERTRAGDIPHYLVGNRYEYDPAELDAWLEAQHVPARESAAS